MDRQQIGLKLALDALGRELSLDEFDSRLALQKLIYLVQAAGVHLGYSYCWYLCGPYSRELISDAFAIRAEMARGGDDWKGWKLDPVWLARLAGLREKFQAIPAASQLRHLDLLTSVHFLVKTRQARADDVPALHRIFLINNKDYAESEIGQAIEELKRSYEQRL